MGNMHSSVASNDYAAARLFRWRGKDVAMAANEKEKGRQRATASARE